jgi:hypothetical protein
MTKRKSLEGKVKQLKWFSNRVVLMSIVQAIGLGIITSEELSSDRWCAKEAYRDLVEQGRQDDEGVVCVWFDRRSNSYKWEI